MPSLLCACAQTAALGTAEKKYSKIQVSEQRIRNRSVSNESSLPIRDERIVLLEGECTDRVKERSGLVALKVGIARRQKENEEAVASVSNADLLSALEQEQVEKLDVESVKLREQTKSSQSRRVVFEYAARGHAAALEREDARCIDVEKKSGGHVATIASLEESFEVKMARVDEFTTVVETEKALVEEMERPVRKHGDTLRMRVRRPIFWEGRWMRWVRQSTMWRRAATP